MHKSAVLLNELFVKVYKQGWDSTQTCRVLEQGSGGHSTYKDIYTKLGFEYSDYELQGGQPQLVLPWEDNTFDVVISNSVFEHDAMFWLSFNEMLRVCKPHGLIFITAPSNGAYHTYPWDCWRFYPDAGRALTRWAKHSGFQDTEMLESFTVEKYEDIWCDYAMVFVKDKKEIERFPKRMVHNVNWAGITNGRLYGDEGILCYTLQPQDQRKDPVPVKEYPPDLLI